MSDKQDSDVGTTIVGGQPPRNRRQTVSVPAGVEKLLYLAAMDDAVRRDLLQDRDRAAAACGVELTPSEAAMVRLAPAAQLEAMIDALDVSEGNVLRRDFLQAVAASAAAVTAGAALGGCSDDDDVKTDTGTTQAGVQADARIDAKVNPGLDAGGIQPDVSYLDAMAGADAKVNPGDYAVKVDVGAPKPAGIRPNEAGVD